MHARLLAAAVVALTACGPSPSMPAGTPAPEREPAPPEAVADGPPEPDPVDPLAAVSPLADGQGTWMRVFEVGYPEFDLRDIWLHDGRLRVMGNFAQAMDFDPGPGERSFVPGGAGDIVMLELDQRGEVLKTWQYGGAGLDKVVSASGCKDQTMLVAGSYEGASGLTLVGPNAPPSGSFLSSLDHAGALRWSYSVPATSGMTFLHVACTADGSAIAFGRHTGKRGVTLETGQTIRPPREQEFGFLARFDAGGMAWLRRFDDRNSTMIVYDLILADDGRIILAGSGGGNMDLDPGPGRAYHRLAIPGAFVIALDSSGQYLWANTVGKTATAEDRTVAVDAQGNVYLGGVFFGTEDFDPGSGTDVHTSQTTDGDAFIVVYARDGSFRWARTFGGGVRDYVTSIVPAGERITVAGWWSSSAVDFDPGPGVTRSFMLDGAFVSDFDREGRFLGTRLYNRLFNPFRMLGDAGGDLYTLAVNKDLASAPRHVQASSAQAAIVRIGRGDERARPRGNERALCAGARYPCTLCGEIGGPACANEPGLWLVQSIGREDALFSPGVLRDGSIVVAGEFGRTARLPLAGGLESVTPAGDSAAFWAIRSPDGQVMARVLDSPGGDGAGVKAVGNDDSFVLQTDGSKPTNRRDKFGMRIFDTWSHLTRMDREGKTLWQFKGHPFGRSIRNYWIDRQGATYISGRFEERMDFDPGPGRAWRGPEGQQSDFLVRLRADGAFSWVRIFEPHALELDRGSGLGEGVVIGVNSRGARRSAEVQMLDEHGAALFSQSLAADEQLELTDIITHAGGITASGVFRGAVDLGPGLGLASGQPMRAGWNGRFVVRYDARGTRVAATLFTAPDRAPNSPWVELMAVADGGFVLAIPVLSSVHIQTPTTQHQVDERGGFLIARVSPAHEVLWTRHLPAIHKTDTVHLLGGEHGHVTVVTHRSEDRHVVGRRDRAPIERFTRIVFFDEQGRPLGERRLEGPGQMSVRPVAHPDGSISLVGEFLGIVDMDPGPARTFVASHGDHDIYLLHIPRPAAPHPAGR